VSELDVVTGFYEAAADPGLLAGALLGLMRHVGADAGIWVDTDSARRTAAGVTQVGLEDQMMGDYVRLGWTGPLVPGIIQAGACKPVTDRRLLPRAEFERSDFFQGWVRPNAMQEGLLATFGPLQQDTVLLTLMRSRRGTPLTFEADGGDARLARLLPHLSRADRLRRRLARVAPLPHGPQAAALDAMTVAVLCLDARHHIVWANAAADRLLRAGECLSTTSAEGIGAATPELTAALHRLCRAAAAGRGGAMQLDCGFDAPAQAVAIPYRLQASDGQLPELGQAGLLLFVSTPEQLLGGAERQANIDRLRSLYRLTMMEAMVALLIAQGQAIPAVAMTLGAAPSTIRSHVKHIFGKMHVHTQLELARIIFHLNLIQG